MTTLPDATNTRPCWPIANRVTRERDREWPNGNPPWVWLCCDIAYDRPNQEDPK